MGLCGKAFVEETRFRKGGTSGSHGAVSFWNTVKSSVNIGGGMGGGSKADPKAKKFILDFTGTQMFQMFLQDRLWPSDRNVEVLLFDRLIDEDSQGDDVSASSSSNSYQVTSYKCTHTMHTTHTRNTHDTQHTTYIQYTHDNWLSDIWMK